MDCGLEIEVVVRYWSTCWKWGFIPYPCRKSKTVTKYKYDFSATRTRITWPFRCRWQGCCGTYLYEWSYWCWLGTGNSAWNQFNTVTSYFDSPLSSIGDCPFNPAPMA